MCLCFIAFFCILFLHLFYYSVILFLTYLSLVEATVGPPLIITPSHVRRSAKKIVDLLANVRMEMDHEDHQQH